MLKYVARPLNSHNVVSPPIGRRYLVTTTAWRATFLSVGGRVNGGAHTLSCPSLGTLGVGRPKKRPLARCCGNDSLSAPTAASVLGEGSSVLPLDAIALKFKLPVLGRPGGMV